MADPIVHITGGVPDSGTGNITTLGQTLLDGANISLGATTDAAVAAGTAGTINAHLRSISRDIVGGIVIQTGTNAIGKVDPNTPANWAIGSSTQNSATVANGNLVLAQFNTTPTVITSGNMSPLQMDANGNLLVNIKAGAGSGGTASNFGAAFPTSGTAIGAEYLSSPPTLVSGQMVALQTDVNGNLFVNIKAGVNANGQALMASSAPVTLASDQKFQTGMSPKGFAAAFTTLTRPANITAYTAGNSISNSTTAASVTALSATVSDTNSDLVTLTDILLSTSDTGCAGKRIRAYLFNSDPTASSGVVNGDGAAYSNKRAGYIGSFSGVMETGFSDGTVGRLVPSFNDSATNPTPNAPAGGLVVTSPSSGGKLIYIQLQAIDGFTPVSGSTWNATARGFQARVN